MRGWKRIRFNKLKTNSCRLATFCHEYDRTSFAFNKFIISTKPKIKQCKILKRHLFACKNPQISTTQISFARLNTRREKSQTTRQLIVFRTMPCCLASQATNNPEASSSTIQIIHKRLKSQDDQPNPPSRTPRNVGVIQP